MERALSIAPTLALGWLSYAAALRTLSRPDGAKAAYHRVLALEPNRVEALNDLATLLMDEKDWAKAAALLSRACELRPQTLGLRMNLAEALAQDGRIEDAAKVARDVLVIDPTDPVGASMFLAKIGEAPTPLRAPNSFCSRCIAFERHGGTQSSPAKDHIVVLPWSRKPARLILLLRLRFWMLVVEPV